MGASPATATRHKRLHKSSKATESSKHQKKRESNSIREHVAMKKGTTTGRSTHSRKATSKPKQSRHGEKFATNYKRRKNSTGNKTRNRPNAQKERAAKHQQKITRRQTAAHHRLVLGSSQKMNNNDKNKRGKALKNCS